MARSFGLLLIFSAYFERVLLHRCGYNVVLHDFSMKLEAGLIQCGLMGELEA